MKKLTQEQALIITGYTNVLCVNSFSAFHADVEKRLGRPVFTHEFPDLKDEIREAYRADFIRLVPEGD